MGSDSIFWSTLAIGHNRSGLLLEAGKLQVLRRVLQKVVVDGWKGASAGVAAKGLLTHVCIRVEARPSGAAVGNGR